jgi:hypothetical protein
MSMSTLQPSSRARRHGPILEPADRRTLERAGWRTTLDFAERHLRARDGQLLEVSTTWMAEATRFHGDFVVASATGSTVEEAWARLRDDIEANQVRSTSRVRIRRS